jgi:hypothetical protein
MQQRTFSTRGGLLRSDAMPLLRAKQGAFHRLHGHGNVLRTGGIFVQEKAIKTTVAAPGWQA